MKVMNAEWRDRVDHWVRTLKEDFYEPLGEITWRASRTMEHLSPEEAQKLSEVDVLVGAGEKKKVLDYVNEYLQKGERIVRITPHTRDEGFEQKLIHTVRGAGYVMRT